MSYKIYQRRNFVQWIAINNILVYARLRVDNDNWASWVHWKDSDMDRYYKQGYGIITNIDKSIRYVKDISEDELLLELL